MNIQLGHDHSKTIGFRCYACHLYLSITAGYKRPQDRSEYYTDKDVNILAKKLGWCRRQFSFNVNPWFCSNKCAMESIQAKELAEYWMVESLK